MQRSRSLHRIIAYPRDETAQMDAHCLSTHETGTGRHKPGVLLFITRKYPPSIGGMEKLSYHVTTGVAARRPARIIKWGGPQKWLPLFVPVAMARALWIIGTSRVELIHIGDLVLAPLGLFLRLISGRPVVITAHGLDVLYANRLYQRVIPACYLRLDAMVCISEHTRQICLNRGVRVEQTVVVPVGIDPAIFRPALTEDARAFWAHRWRLTVRPKHILLTVGRLVPRKGVHFFVSQVLPRLGERRNDWVYVIVGDGPERAAIEATVQAQGATDSVRILGKVSDDELGAAYAMADIFVMPNVPVPGDSEGFGLVSLEARMAGLPVVASRLEGITDSFATDQDGVLVAPLDVSGFVDAIDCLLDGDLTPESRRRRTTQVETRYSWDCVIDRYLAVFEAVQAGRPVNES
jgi:phosphatidyl-myo-inositol dimannoside synthase